ncbi:helix-turn-helix domain-containing protein [Sphingobacterium griseoflavum]|uniref:AraC family transcriptional regulator n=1 Tax=Sphingobacterium griseoflavum TaxID=1474952 RepID=A0ABQ3HUT1_9SPHI|nr:helix-turn-helix transcriptional regulator [Sphingobacterium griseoflavum]GHE36658.1 AraC family transcriptional regulator [Sphingobacterium griseoflavum]
MKYTMDFAEMTIPLYMASKIPVIAQCTVTNSLQHGGLLVEDLAVYLGRNKNLVFPHRHNFYHFILFTSGSGSHSIDFEQFEIEPWQMYFMSPGQIHTWAFDKDIAGFVINFDRDFFKTFLLRPEYVNNFSFFSGLVKDEVFVVVEQEREALLHILARLLAHVDDLDFARISLLYLFHVLEKQRRLPDVGENNLYNHTLLRNFMDLIETNYRRLRLPKEYAALLYITPNHLNALAKEFLGFSAGELIRDRIVLEAKRLLVIHDYSVSDIAYELNFNDNSYFTKFFKKATGLTPDEFRKTMVIKHK